MRIRLTILVVLVFSAALGYSTLAQETEPQSAGMMAYVSQYDGYVAALTDLNREIVTRPFRLDGQGIWMMSGYPNWSPDFRQFAFDGEVLQPSGDGIPGLFLVDAQTGELSSIYEGFAYFPRFSPDGRRLAFVAYRQAPEAALFDLDTERLTWLGQTNGAQTFIGWSPDGQQVAFSGAEALVIVNADGSHPREVEIEPGSLAATVWSPDATHIAAAGFDGAYLIDVMTLQAEQLASYRRPLPGCGCAVSFSPDSRWLALPVTTESGAGVRVIDLQTDASYDVTLDGYLDNTRFSPDSLRLLVAVTGFSDEIDYSHQREVYGTAIRLLNLENRAVRDIKFIAGGFRVAWPPSLDFTALDAISTIFTPTVTPTPSLTPTSTLTSTPPPTFTPTATPIVCDGAPPTRLRVGMSARVTIAPPDQPRQDLRVRDAPNGERIASLSEGTQFTIIGSPVCAGDYLWWPIETLDGSVKGWSAEGALPDAYFIEAAP